MATAAALSRSDSFPEINRKFTLVTKQAQEIYSRSYRALSAAHVYIGVIARITNNLTGDARDAEANKAEETLKELYTGLLEALANEDKRLEKLLEDNGISDIADYSEPKEITIPLRSPWDSSFLSELTIIDQCVTKLDTLWICGVVNDAQKVQATTTWKRRVIKSANRIIQLSQSMRNSASQEVKIKQDVVSDKPTLVKDTTTQAEDTKVDTKKVQSLETTTKPKKATTAKKKPGAVASLLN